MEDNLKRDVDETVQIVSYIMKKIQDLDKIYNDLEHDPESQSIIAMKILQYGNDFEALTVTLKSTLGKYLNYLSENNLPIPLTYKKLQKQIKDV